MHFRAAAILLLCLSWHQALPLASLTVRPQTHRTETIAATQGDDPSRWEPRSSDARELAQVLARAAERHGPRASQIDTRCVRPTQPIATQCGARSESHRGAYPARRWLHRMPSGGGEDTPPA